MNKYCLCLYIIIFCLINGCVVKKKIASETGFQQGTYSSKFTSTEVSLELEKITHAVKKVFSVSSYTSYQFRREAKITAYHLANGSYKKAAWGIVSMNETVFGTATVISHSGPRVALLTCAHIIESPDTIISWFEVTPDDPVRYIRSFSKKDKQENWVKDLSPCGPFNILASDNTNDIAILGKNCETITDTIAAFPFPIGHAKELSWGCFVYLFGYPFGNQVVTSGIVSPLPKRPQGEFSVDALLNKGFSGGIIVASKNAVPGFELLGIVKTVNSSREDFLKPDPERSVSLDWMPYNGEMFVGKSEIIQYGINAVVPIETITEFYKKNRSDLILSGYNLDAFFNLSR